MANENQDPEPRIESIDLLERIKNGDVQAQHQVFDEYVLRLLGLVRHRLSKKFTRRIDADDVVQSAYRSFFNGVHDDRFAIENSGDLWRLLAAITMNKMQKQIVSHSAEKRSVHREQTLQMQMADSCCEIPLKSISTEPTTEDEAALSEEIALLTRELSQQQCEMLELRLAGFHIDEIALQIACSERTVRRFFDQKVKPFLQTRLG